MEIAIYALWDIIARRVNLTAYNVRQKRQFLAPVLMISVIVGRLHAVPMLLLLRAVVVRMIMSHGKQPAETWRDVIGTKQKKYAMTALRDLIVQIVGQMQKIAPLEQHLKRVQNKKATVIL